MAVRATEDRHVWRNTKIDSRIAESAGSTVRPTHIFGISSASKSKALRLFGSLAPHCPFRHAWFSESEVLSSAPHAFQSGIDRMLTRAQPQGESPCGTDTTNPAQFIMSGSAVVGKRRERAKITAKGSSSDRGYSSLAASSFVFEGRFRASTDTMSRVG
jgi:hypothetical protein